MKGRRRRDPTAATAEAAGFRGGEAALRTVNAEPWVEEATTIVGGVRGTFFGIGVDRAIK